MPFLNGLTVLLLFQLVGELGVRLLGLPLPGPVLGMGLLFAALALRRRCPDSLEHASGALLAHLSLLFVPAGVGVMVHFRRLGEEWLALTAALVVSTFCTLLVTAFAMRGLMRLAARARGE